jgi:starch synthase
MHVLFVASECAPFVKTGGLGDVVAALPRALAREGADVRILMPAYPAMLAALGPADETIPLGVLFGGPARLVTGTADGLRFILLDAPHLYDRPGNPYTDAEGQGRPDNDIRYAALCQAAREVALAGIGGWMPDVVHAHDWQAGLVPLYLKFAGKPTAATVLTIHNIAFQGLFDKSRVALLGLPPAEFTMTGYEFFDQVGFLKAGMVYADKVTTVSPTYARELLAPAFGMGLEGVLASRQRDFSGILNGIDLEAWNPADDPHIAQPYGGSPFKAKAANKAALEAAFGLEPAPGRPLFCVISRLTWQKGLDVLLDALPALVAGGGRLVVLGTGDRPMQAAFQRAARLHPTAMAVKIGYSEPLSHLMQAGADAILVPSRFEPCGLTQLYGLRYGTLPIVARTGGLADTVIDANDAALKAGAATGFQFAPVTVTALTQAIRRATALYADRSAWRRMVRRAIAHPVGWEQSARDYLDLYHSLEDSRP